MKVSHKWLQRYFREELPIPDELADLFTFHSFEMEGIEEKGNDAVLDAKILPDRAHYALSHRGIAEEVRVLTGLAYTEQKDILIDIDHSVEKVDVKIEDEIFCRRYTACRINNINVGESSSEIKTLLEAIGARSINSVVDATNFVMFDVGQPLHAFDADKVKGSIVVRRSKEDEKITLLDGTEVNLTKDDFVIADDEGPLAIAGVKGGKRAEVNGSTKNIILESANFHPGTVRKTSVKFNLRNESSKRFENEITAELTMDALEHVVVLIQTFSPEARVGEMVDNYPIKKEKTKISVTTDFINGRLGVEIPQDTITDILKKFDIGIIENGNVLQLTIPFHRLDLVIKEDIVEEVGRIYGYEKIEGILPPPISNVKVNPIFAVTEKIKEILVEQGFSEVYLYTFASKGEIEVAYPLASDKKFLRTNLEDGMRKCLEMNRRNADFLFLDSLRVSEIGKTFTKDKESLRLILGAEQIKKQKGVNGESIIKDVLLKLGTALKIDLSGEKITTKENKSVVEIDLDPIISKQTISDDINFPQASKLTYVPFSHYPFIVRDIAVFVPSSVEPEEVLEIIISNGGELLLKWNLFDTFEKEGKTSYAYRLIFQSFEKTLTDEEISKVMEIISEKMKEKGWKVR